MGGRSKFVTIMMISHAVFALIDFFQDNQFEMSMQRSVYFDVTTIPSIFGYILWGITRN
jgi:hypothetical protein